MPRPLRVGILHNRFSGKGRGPDFVARLYARVSGDAGLRERYDLIDLPLDLATAEGGLDRLDAVVLVGGDGTIHHSLPMLTAAKEGQGVPTLLAPLGTENVIARELGLKPSVTTTLRALDAFRNGAATMRSDLGVVHHPDGSGTLAFALMLTTGPDAAILHRVAQARTGTTSKLLFVRPTLARGLRPRVGRLSVSVDGVELADTQRGCLIVAVGPRYPLKLDLARHATRTDGLLDGMFLPASTTASLLGWVALARVGLHVKHPKARYAQGRRIEFTMHDHDPNAEMIEDLQIDGEIERVACDAQGKMVVESLPSALPLILPGKAKPEPAGLHASASV